MRTVLAASLAALLWPAGSFADSKNSRSRPYDVTEVKDRLEVLSDGKGHYVVLASFPMCDETPQRRKLREAVFYGDGKRFWRVALIGTGATCREHFAYTFWDPRFRELWKSGLAYKGGRYTVRCDDRVTDLAPVAADEKQRILGKAAFHDPPWNRRPYALARDERGTYYFVDVRRDAEGGRNLDFRLYVGPRGNLKLQRMRNVISDSEGDIFTTRGGELRLILGREEAFWIRGKKRTSLTIVPVEENGELIYTDLGPYLGERLGTPCDDL